MDFLKNIGTTELIIIGVILIVFFGARKIADLGKTGGETVKEVKKIKKELTGTMKEVNEDTNEEVES